MAIVEVMVEVRHTSTHLNPPRGILILIDRCQMYNWVWDEYCANRPGHEGDHAFPTMLSLIENTLREHGYSH